MSPRTLIVGVLAAVCGICATAGVMKWMRPADVQGQTIITAKTNISLGSRIEPQMLQQLEWHSQQIPIGAFSSPDQIIGKYCTAQVYAGQPILASLLDSAPTSLQPEPGYYAVAIDTETESSSLGKNLVAGNRVDIIWVMTKSHETLGGPFSIRLLENVRVLAVGQNSTSTPGTDSRRDLKSVTLEVKAKMDENLVLAQELGTLSLVMRNPNDQSDVEPTLITNIEDLMRDAVLKKSAGENNPALEAVAQLKQVFDNVVGRVDQLSQKIDQLKEAPKAQAGRASESRQRIPAGMRAITVQTPSESTGVAGLLLPGDRVDVVLTWNNEFYDRFSPFEGERHARSLMLCENVEVYAVDAQMLVPDENSDKEMSRSVTLIGTEEMALQIPRAQGIGTLTLVLRGTDDSKSSDPRLLVDLDQYLDSRLGAFPLSGKSAAAGGPRSSIVPINLNRGGANQNQLFLVPPKAAPKQESGSN